MWSTRERTNRKNGLRLSLWGQMYKNCIKKHGNTYLFFFNFEKYLCIKAKRMFFSRFASRKPQNISNFVARTKFMTWVRCSFSLLSNVPHVARNVWVRCSYSLKITPNSFYITTCFLPNGNGERRTMHALLFRFLLGFAPTDTNS